MTSGGVLQKGAEINKLVSIETLTLYPRAVGVVDLKRRVQHPKNHLRQEKR